MMRVEALEAAGGYRDDLIAGEEPELCVRLRAAGWKIWRLDHEMTLHDAAMLHFSQWWRRQMRSGYAFAQGAKLHGRAPESHWVWESRRALIWGLGFPIVCITRDFFIGMVGGFAHSCLSAADLASFAQHARRLAHAVETRVFRTVVAVCRGDRRATVFPRPMAPIVTANSSSTSECGSPT